MKYVLIAQHGSDSFEMQEQMNRFSDTKNAVYVFYQAGNDVLTIDGSKNDVATIHLNNSQAKKTDRKEHKNEATVYRYLLVELVKKMKPDDELVCDTVFRIADTAGKLSWVYRAFLKHRVNLCFLDEPVINSYHFTNLIDDFDNDQLEEINNLLTDLYKMRSSELIADKNDVFKQTAIEEYLPKYTNKNKAIAMPVIKKMHKSFGGYMTTGVLRQYLLDTYQIDVPDSTMRRYIAEARNTKNK